MKLKKRITMPWVSVTDKRKKRRLFRQMAKDSVWPETREMALSAARWWGR